jgi:hypothetical protein
MRRRWQYGVADLLLLMLIVSVVLGVSRLFPGRVGPIELGIVMVAAISVLIAAVCSRVHWPWIFALLVLCVTLGCFAPAPMPARLLIAAGILAVYVAAVYVAAGLPVILVSEPDRKRWPWVVGSLACFLTAAFITPPDPQSMLAVAVPLCSCYLLVAAVWRYSRSALLVIGPAMLVVGVGLALVGQLAASQGLARWVAVHEPNSVAAAIAGGGMPARIGVPIAVLGAVVAFAACFSRLAGGGTRGSEKMRDGSSRDAPGGDGA